MQITVCLHLFNLPVIQYGNLHVNAQKLCAVLFPLIVGASVKHNLKFCSRFHLAITLMTKEGLIAG